MTSRSASANFIEGVKLPPRSRGRPRVADSEALRNHILIVAKEVFVEMGYGNATMDEIASRARVSKETLYTRFPNKPEVFKAVIAAQLRAWEQGSTDKYDVVETTHLRDALRWHARVQLIAMKDREFRAIIRLVTSESERFPEVAEMFLEQSRHDASFTLVRDIQKFADLDGVPCMDPESVAKYFRSMIAVLGSPVNLAKYLDPEEEAREVDRIIDLLVGGRPAW